MLVQPAERVIRGRELIIIPDAALYNLAFEALIVNPPTGSAPLRYLVEDHPITYAPSASALVEIVNRPKRIAPKNEILLVGDPVFNTEDPRAKEKGDAFAFVAMNVGGRLRGGLHRLPSTEREVREIAAIGVRYRLRPTVWLGFEASEENLKRRDLATYRFLHLATHAVADTEDGELSAIVLSLASGDCRSETKAHKECDDGILTAAEVARLRLDADLVVLSGCETGTGQRTAAESVIGLGRAFLLAGARRVCGSLWKVEDAATEMLMTNFYNGLLARGLTTSHALRLAKLTLIRRGFAPFYWAPFILIGSP
jgi:CHAT domain-containing protein